MTMIPTQWMLCKNHFSFNHLWVLPQVLKIIIAQQITDYC